ncbi:MAG: RNA polymerase sigma factor [Pseudomonadota bacterium]
MAEPSWIGAALTAARPRAVGALVRHFRDIDRAEDAFQEACLRAVKAWPKSGLPSDPTAWLIFVGRNAAIDDLRRTSRVLPLSPGDDQSIEPDMEGYLDEKDYRDDILRLLFVCSHPSLSVPDQLALALKIVAGLSVQEIARAFLVTPKAMEQRITRAKRRVAQAELTYETPSASERAQRLNAVSTMIYLMFNEGYASAGGDAHIRVALCEEAIRLLRLLLGLFPGQSEVMGLLALCLFQHSRYRARLSGDDTLVRLEDQDRTLWDQQAIREGQILIEKALRKPSLGPYQIQAAIAGVHCAAKRAADTDWREIDRLYAALEEIDPSPIVTLNRAVAVSKSTGPKAALSMIEPLEKQLAGYFYFHGTKAALLEDVGRPNEARRAYQTALSLSSTSAESALVRRRLEKLSSSAPAGVGTD